jgi:hypothetical protein
VEVVEDLLHVAAVAAPVARPNRRLRGRGGARQGRRHQRGVLLRGGAVLAHVCAPRCGSPPPTVPPPPSSRTPGARARASWGALRAPSGAVGLCLSEVGMGGRVGVGWGMQSWNRRSGDDKKRKWVGGRQGKDYEEGCVTGMA